MMYRFVLTAWPLCLIDRLRSHSSLSLLRQRLLWLWLHHQPQP